MFLYDAKVVLYGLLSSGAAIMGVMAFAHCALSNSAAYVAYGKRTKGFWLAVSGISMLFSLFGMYAAWTGNGGLNLFALVAAVVSGVFLADVKPLVSGRRA